MSTFFVVSYREGDIAFDLDGRFRIVTFSVGIDDREGPGSFIVCLCLELDIIVLVSPALDRIFRCICLREGQCIDFFSLLEV